MTDLLQTDLRPISIQKITTMLLMTVILGSVAGFAASEPMANSQGIAIVSIGRQDQTSFIEEPLAVVERIKSAGFAAAASTRSGISELSTLLPARQYGGRGALNAHTLRDLSLIEIRIDVPEPELAQKAINAVVEELIANHEEKIAPLIQNLQSTLPALDRSTSEMIKARDAIAKRLGASFQNGEIDQESAVLLSARALTEAGLGAMVKSASELRLLSANIRKTQLVATPMVTTAKATSLYRIVATGMLVGLLVGLLSLQMFPGFFRIGQPSLETSGGAL
jgi:hypothetical protein